MYSAVSGPTDWILRYIKTTFFIPLKSAAGNSKEHIEAVTQPSCLTKTEGCVA